MSSLTNVQIEFLKIVESFLHEKDYHLPEDFTELTELYKLSVEHKLSPVVFEQIRGEAIWKQEEWKELFQVWKKNMIKEVMLQTQRTEGFLRVYEKLKEAGVKPLVVKGLVCRNMYPKPEYRVSGDEDILIRKEEFEICDKVFLNEGFQREEVDLNDLPYEVSYINPINGVYVEMHMSLFSNNSNVYSYLNDEFRQVFNTCVEETYQNVNIWTLEPTLHLLFLIFHSFKHFLHGGFGIRQLCDMVRVIEYYDCLIDWNYIQNTASKYRMKEFWTTLFKIGEDCLRYNGKHYISDNKLYQRIDYFPLLLDILQSGVYGSSTKERKHSANMTYTAVEKGEKNIVASLKASVFPERTYMERKFEWVRQHKWLLPVAYLVRIFNYLKQYMKKDRDDKNGLQIGAERVELLRLYNIID